MDEVVFGGIMLALGVGVGIVSGALGIGGGTLMVPAFLQFVPGMDIHTAKGSSLFIIIFVSMWSSWKMNRGAHRAPWDMVALLALGSMAGGYFGGWATGLMPERTVTLLFVALIGYMAYRTFFLMPRVVREEDVRRRRAWSVGIGIAAGIVGGGTGTGGGAVLVPMALFAGISSNERVVALSNTVMIATAAAGALAHFMGEKTAEIDWTYGQVTLSLAPLVFLGAVAGTPAGRAANARMTLGRRRAIMGVLLAVISLRLLANLL